MAPNPEISGAVEGTVDDAVLRRLITEAGFVPATIYNTGGKANMRQRIRGFNSAARFSTWVVVADLDSDYPCPGRMVHDWLPKRSKNMYLRIAVHQVEAWLMGDRERFSRFLRIPVSRVPVNPDLIIDAKRLVVDLARQSRDSSIRGGIVPRAKSGRKVGPEYTALMVEFSQRWNLVTASETSPSLGRALKRLKSPGPR